jgi:hypothetical protein
MLQFLKLFQFVTNITCFSHSTLLTLGMNWQDMYEVSLDRIKQLQHEINLLRAILRSYLPIVERKQDEER